MKRALPFATCLFLAAGNAQAAEEVIGEWECFEWYTPYGETPALIVEAQAYIDSFGLFKGDIRANGIDKDSTYQQQGLEHRWDFDLNPDGSYDAAFLIEADGTGKYYYFGSSSTSKPRLLTKCTKTK